MAGADGPDHLLANDAKMAHTIRVGTDWPDHPRRRGRRAALGEGRAPIRREEDARSGQVQVRQVIRDECDWTSEGNRETSAEWRASTGP